MNTFDKIKELYWNNNFMSDRQKDVVFAKVKAIVKGKVDTNADDSMIKEYVTQVLNGQKLDNNFSVDYPVKKRIELTDEDAKLLAYYLPQYYPNKYNDAWWGKGSTEWTNVTKSVPQYLGQYQPRLPGELGFYDLRIQDNIYRQIELAKIYGIYGFCFYYYWFDGVRLLDLPFDNFVNDETIDYPFCINWINESWTKQWSGDSNLPLMEVVKTVESYKRFIESCYKLFEKDNYIKIDGKPVLLIYKPLDVPEAEKVISYWRNYVKEKLGVDLYLIATINKQGILREDFSVRGFDAISEFAPGPQLEYMEDITKQKQYVCGSFYGKVYDYKKLIEDKAYFKVTGNKLYRAVSPMWDNTARKMNKGLVLDGATPELYKTWLKDVIVETKNNKDLDDKLVFINAWNEWAEGTYLEPDLKWQYKYLEATKDAILEAREVSEKISEQQGGQTAVR